MPQVGEPGSSRLLHLLQEGRSQVALPQLRHISPQVVDLLPALLLLPGRAEPRTPGVCDLERGCLVGANRRQCPGRQTEVCVSRQADYVLAGTEQVDLHHGLTGSVLLCGFHVSLSLVVRPRLFLTPDPESARDES